MKYVVIKSHRSEYPQPICFAKGALLTVGQRFEGHDGWQDWYLCSCQAQTPGWVPAQIIEALGVGQGRAREPYNAHELDVDPGQLIETLRALNGWYWCRRLSNGELGWLPGEVLHLQG
ncbi:SH3 domain-containing protein [Pseudomonas cremoricolorata]|uniref:Variant SH3 domain-containing protein n=1 Tax=Pseudomonas cremoricolorata TaxID=157783 RepID=A0A089YHX0_9PSED|nr:SH3 domain-containing protein [Pseudomonas cremoricolorata]AIR91293.1 variant SH3 domain-containing protein [Pseudomonas cremoricolorata]